MSKVLVADSNKQNVDMLRSLLESNGYEVTSAGDIAQALAEAWKDPPDLLVTNVLMSMIDEYALCHQWRADDRLRRIPLLVYGGENSDEKDGDLALRAAADRF